MSSTFVYWTQLRRNGPYIKKETIAESAKAAERKLMDGGTPVLSIEKKEKRKRGKGEVKLRKMSTVDLAQFATQMHTTTIMQLPIVEALILCAETTRSRNAALIIKDLIKTVETGASLAAAMQKSNAFDNLTLGLVVSGEASGTLDKSFKQIRELSERKMLLRSKIKAALTYPIIVIIVAVIVVYIMMLKAVPVFVNMFAAAHVALPMPTRILIQISHVFSTYPMLILFIILAIVSGCIYVPVAYRTNPWMHKYLMKMPIFGPVAKKIIQATFTRTFTTMIGSKTSRIVDTLGYCRMVSDNYIFKGIIARAMMSVQKGNAVWTAFEGEEDLLGRPLVKQMRFAEQTGEMESILSPMADALDAELMDLVNNLKTVIEPILIGVISAIVGFVVMALLLPTMNMSALVPH